VSPFHQRTIAALSDWLGAGTGSEILKTRGSSEARIADASDALEALRREHEEAVAQVAYVTDKLVARDNQIAALETKLSRVREAA
jgi:predicted  nucleic acid-binding Zn-ribbon protein